MVSFLSHGFTSPIPNELFGGCFFFRLVKGHENQEPPVFTKKDGGSCRSSNQQLHFSLFFGVPFRSLKWPSNSANVLQVGIHFNSVFGSGAGVAATAGHVFELWALLVEISAVFVKQYRYLI